MSKKGILFMILSWTIIFSSDSLIAGQSEEKIAKCADGMWDVTFSDLKRKLLAIGENRDKFAGRLAELVQYSENQRVYGEAVIDSFAMADYMRHDLNLITESLESTNAKAFVFNTALKIPKYAMEGYYFETNSMGELQKAFVIRGKLDEKSNAIPKSGEPIILNINDPDVRERFDHEMQVWLKGMHRKKQAVAPAQPH